MHLNIIKNDIWQICEICDQDGISPLLDWFQKLNRKYKGPVRKMLAILDQVATNPHGPRLLQTDISHEVNKNESIYEFIAGDLRLLWFYSDRQRKMIICGCQHLKKTKKVNNKEVERIVRIKNNYMSAHDVGEIVYFDNGEQL